MSRSSRWPFIRMQAWNRDKKARAVCHICGEPIDYFLPPSSGPDAYEPEESFGEEGCQPGDGIEDDITEPGGYGKDGEHYDHCPELS